MATEWGAAMTGEPALFRSLGICERFFYLYSLTFPVHFCLAARIEGALDFVQLGAALDAVRFLCLMSRTPLSMPWIRITTRSASLHDLAPANGWSD